MSLTRKQLRELKSEMAKKNPDGLAAIKNASNNSKTIIKKIKKSKDFTRSKSVVRWNFKPNQLVKVTGYDTQKIGLIVSDFEYFSSRVEKNCFFVFLDYSVKQIDGRYLRQL
tara:strand:+ start:1297 stop:1632 length:336 start_codon:yes stop_codon:yes gene_type:complete